MKWEEFEKQFEPTELTWLEDMKVKLELAVWNVSFRYRLWRNYVRATLKRFLRR